MIPVETKKKILEELLYLADAYDVERAHGLADDYLLEILREEGGYDDIIEAYGNIPKWYA